MDLKLLQKIIEIFEASSLWELEIEEKGTRFRLSKKRGKEPLFPQQVPSSPKQSEEKKVREMEGEKKKLTVVRSPLVGTLYQALSPEDKPLVKVRDKVVVGQTLCVIEAMKVMNEITSEVNGRIKDILIKNGQPVEYDQELFVIKEH